jgi:hypothetical protein
MRLPSAKLPLCRSGFLAPEELSRGWGGVGWDQMRNRRDFIRGIRKNGAKDACS